MNNCFHCGELIDTTKDDHFIMRHYSKGVSKKSLDFHLECFEEIAGQDYIDKLVYVGPPDRTEEAFAVHNKTSPPVGRMPVSIPSPKGEPYKMGEGRTCNLCYKTISGATHQLDNNREACVGCWTQLNKGSPK